MGRIFFVVAAAMLMVLEGCSLDPSKSSKEYGVEALSLSKDSAAMILQKAITKNGSEGIVDPPCFNVPTAAGEEAKCQQQRNAALAALLVASDDLCQQHLKSIYGNDAYFNIMTGSIASLFSGAAAIAGSASAKSALAAISTFAIAERSLINETVYKNMLVTATTKKIRETRDTKAAALLPSSFKKSIDDYPIVLAMRDAVDYHYSCSFMLGLEKALEEGTQSGVEGKKAKLEQEKRGLELYIDTRTASLTAAGHAADVAGDKGLVGAKGRIEAIETQLLVLLRSQAATAGTGDKQVDGAAPKADSATLSKAYYLLKAKLEAGKTTLSTKINGATAATGVTKALATKVNTNVDAVITALNASTCQLTIFKTNGDIEVKQGELTAASDEAARAKLNVELNLLTARAGQFAKRLTTFESGFTSTTTVLSKAIDDAKQAISSTLNTQIDTELNSITVPASLCTP
ncbi:MAG: hypothetical protein A3H35_08030 [Betaproteobacteria bacterium RIFCSPLOWO2_02_FULL_62_17]|nr:MAG: hypothetical protein A3H35_08030 [Betaproteobacteria bacterium RIFCSPLOWO2_02_FULL_62_17]